MFEQIHLISYHTETPVTPLHSLLHLSPDLDQEEYSDDTHADIKRSIEEKRRFFTESQGELDFLISGHLDVFSIASPSEFARSQLYYLEGFSVFTCDPGFFTRRKEYPSFLLLYTYEGCGVLEYEDKTYELGENYGFLIDCRKRHLYYTKGQIPWKHSVLHFNGPLVRSFYDQFFAEQSPVFHDTGNPFYQKHLELLLQDYQQGGMQREWLVSDRLSHLLTNLARHEHRTQLITNRNPGYILVLTVFLERHFTRKVSLNEMSKIAGVSKYHLSREFQRYTGYTPLHYLNMLRIEHAKSLLTGTSLSAAKIAALSGFEDVNNFSRHFKKNTGITPGAFRKQVIGL
ncbi:MAG: helix-turn-helix domain-containing protein [Lachnospiraceae bacterium]